MDPNKPTKFYDAYIFDLDGTIYLGETLLPTALAVHTCDAVMCRLFAHNNRYPKNLWTLLGFVFGIWAVALLLLLPRRRSDSAPTPHDSATT